MDNSLTVIFRTDASLEIGTGHVMRCLTLALGLMEKGASVSFLCREHDGNLIKLIRSHGFVVHVLPLLSHGDDTKKNSLDPAHAAWLGCDWRVDVEHCKAIVNDPVDWIIVDHYALDYRWENAMRDKCEKMMCIDDLADRVHDCDLLIDQSFGRSPSDYLNLVLRHPDTFRAKICSLAPRICAMARDQSSAPSVTRTSPYFSDNGGC